MGEPEDIKDQPLNQTWSEDWARAEERAAQWEESNEAAHASEQEAEQSTDGGSDDDGAGDSEGSGGEEGLESASEAEGGESESRSGSEDGQGSGDSGEPGHGDLPQQGGERRDDGASEQESSLSRADRIARLKDDAAALGYEFEGNRVEVSERAKFREEKRATRQKLQAERDRVQQELSEATDKLESQFERAKKLQSAIEANDLAGVAQALGHESWEHLSEAALKRQLDPSHTELMKLRREKVEAEEREKRQAEERQRQEDAARVEQARASYRESLSGEVGKLKDKKLSQFANDPAFIAGVLAHQEQEWDGEESISVQEAAQRAYNDAKALYDRLAERFGDRTTTKSESSVPTGGARSAEKPPSKKAPPKVVSQREAVDASANEDPDHFDPKAWERKWARQIKDSSYEDNAQA